MIAVELWGGPQDGMQLVLQSLVDRIRVHDETEDDEHVCIHYVPAGVIKRGVYVYVPEADG